MTRETSYHRLRGLLQAKIETSSKGVTFLEAQTVSGHSFELWATVDENEIDTRFFVVAPGMRVFHVYLSDFQQLLHARDKVVTDPVEGTVYGQAIYAFRLLVSHVESQCRECLEAAEQSMDAIVHWPAKALVESLKALGRNYRHVVMLDGQLVTGELIKTR